LRGEGAERHPDLLQRGIESVADMEEFLSATLQEIAKVGFDGDL